MNPFSWDAVMLPALVIFAVTCAVTFRITRHPVVALLAGFAKAGIYFVYFTFLFDGTYTFIDDWTYLEGGEDFLIRDVGITNLDENWGFATAIAQSEQFLYYLYNAYALRLFGIGYYAPVALNVLCTVGIAWAGARLAEREFQVGPWFFLFLLFHPDILAWSNVMNGKDVLVLFLHILILSAVSLAFAGRIFVAIAIGVTAGVAVGFLRFYAPILISIAIVATLLLKSAKHRFFNLSIAMLIFGLAIYLLGMDRFTEAISVIGDNFVNPLYGFVHFMLTPIPFNTDENYAFLDVPSLIHWMLMPAVIYGVFAVRRKGTVFSTFFLIYIAAFVLLYSVFSELQGPRHRVQLDYAIAVLQYLGLPFLLRFLSLKPTHSVS